MASPPQPKQKQPSSPVVVIAEDEAAMASAPASMAQHQLPLLSSAVLVEDEDADKNKNLSPPEYHHQQYKFGDDDFSKPNYFAFPMSQRELLRRRERFLVFTRILLRLLLRRDPDEYERLRAVLWECTQHYMDHGNGVAAPHPSFLVPSMYWELVPAVRPRDWRHAHFLLDRFYRQRQSRSRRNNRPLPAEISADGS